MKDKKLLFFSVLFFVVGVWLLWQLYTKLADELTNDSSEGGVIKVGILIVIVVLFVASIWVGSIYAKRIDQNITRRRRNHEAESRISIE